MSAPLAKYRCLDPVQHVKTRPGMYMGSVESSTSEHWVADIGEESVSVRRTHVTLVPALRKLFDEAVSNAGDASIKDGTVKRIDVSATVVDARMCFSVRNDGAGIPTAVLSDEHRMPVPEAVFGHLHSGENLGDGERLVAGQNGLGIKLCNIFSSIFKASTRHAETGSVWAGEWRDGMRLVSSVVKPGKPKAGFVDVLFVPDEQLALGATHADAVALFARRVLDLALTVRPGTQLFNSFYVSSRFFTN